MRIQPIYNYTKFTEYGRDIRGKSRGYEYDVYIKENKVSKNIEHKLYCVYKDGNWVKSILRFYNNNKLIKEIKSQRR